MLCHLLIIGMYKIQHRIYNNKKIIIIINSWPSNQTTVIVLKIISNDLNSACNKSLYYPY